MIQRFGMAMFIAMGRLLFVVGILFFFQRLIIGRDIGPTILVGLMYGGGLCGLGTTFIKMGRLGRRLEELD